MPQPSHPKIARFIVRAVRVPMRPPHQTASGTVAESPLVLMDIVLDDGTVGHSVTFTYTPMTLQPVAELVRNFEALCGAQLLSVTPTAHWLEYADWWNPVMRDPLVIRGGMTDVTEVTGSGVQWNESAIAALQC